LLDFGWRFDHLTPGRLRNRLRRGRGVRPSRRRRGRGGRRPLGRFLRPHSRRGRNSGNGGRAGGMTHRRSAGARGRQDDETYAQEESMGHGRLHKGGRLQCFPA
jgi:hypothetical protein